MAATAVAEAVEGHGLPSLGPVRTNARALPAEPPTPLERERSQTCHDGRDGLSPAYQRPRGAPFGGVASADPRMAAQEKVGLEICCIGCLNPPGRGSVAKARPGAGS